MKITILVSYLLSSSSLIISNAYMQQIVFTSVSSETSTNGSHKIFAIVLSVTLIMIIVGLIKAFVTKLALSIKDKKD